MDRQLDIYGVHVGIKCNEVADWTKGGQLHVKVDDMKKIFPRAHSKAIDVNVEFEGRLFPLLKDNLFNFRIDYVREHVYGYEEKGYLTFNRQMAGDSGVWTTKVESKIEAFSLPLSAATNIPKRIGNMNLEISSDGEIKFSLSYKNPNMNRDSSINANRVPGKDAHVVISNGARKHDLTFKVKDIDADGNFEIGVEGTSPGGSTT